MAAISSAIFKKAADLSPVIYLAGAENFLIERHLKNILEIGAPEDMRDFNLDVLYGPDTKAAKVISIARSFPMMAERRVVVVKDIQKMPAAEVKQILEYAKKPNPTTIFVVVARTGDLRQKGLDAFKKAGKFIECKPLYENRIAPWIEEEVRNRGKNIARDAAASLAMQVGTNLQEVSNEIDKLLIYLGDQSEITSQDVAAVAGFRKEYSIFALQNALGEKNLKLALDIYDQLQSAAPPQTILFQLTRFFTNLMIATGFKPGGQNDSELAKLTRTHVFFVKDLHRFKQKYTIGMLENALENIRHVDFALKTFSVDQSMLVQLLFIHIVRGYPANRLPFGNKNT